MLSKLEGRELVVSPLRFWGGGGVVEKRNDVGGQHWNGKRAKKSLVGYVLLPSPEAGKTF